MSDQMSDQLYREATNAELTARLPVWVERQVVPVEPDYEAAAMALATDSGFDWQYAGKGEDEIVERNVRRALFVLSAGEAVDAALKGADDE